jgi:hypothetical protein
LPAFFSECGFKEKPHFLYRFSVRAGEERPIFDSEKQPAEELL